MTGCEGPQVSLTWGMRRARARAASCCVSGRQWADCRDRKDQVIVWMRLLRLSEDHGQRCSPFSLGGVDGRVRETLDVLGAFRKSGVRLQEQDALRHSLGKPRHRGAQQGRATRENTGVCQERNSSMPTLPSVPGCVLVAQGGSPGIGVPRHRRDVTALYCSTYVLALAVLSGCPIRP